MKEMRILISINFIQALIKSFNVVMNSKILIKINNRYLISKKGM